MKRKRRRYGMFYIWLRIFYRGRSVAISSTNDEI